MKHQTAALNRAEIRTLALLKSQSHQHLQQIQTLIHAIDQACTAIPALHDRLKKRFDVRVSIPSIGASPALALLIDRPERGSMNAKQTASLGGLAPLTRQSGHWSGKSSIQGGRANLRQALYRPALVAIRFNPPLKAKYLALRAAGKPGKVALVAVMRKLLILAHALLRDNHQWSLEVA